ncbi:MAG: hypothetical protein IPF92_00885 [Myxococcales bacterium]|nr:hypothetical protein [Myxococcales bacterium]MBL0193685.1 hypothetical protein [Myxococcales bacterium]HQY61649.1 hypothetical protein [Polyangiaceae bacterium]
MLHQLARIASPTSEDAAFAHQKLAELLAEEEPWRAALYARRVLQHFPTSHRAWAVLALSQSTLGHFRFARTAYQRALELAPKNGSYAHNLGHLLDVALGDPHAAVPWLRRAHDGARSDPSVAASYAHALGRSGRWADAKKVLGRALAHGPTRELSALARWVERRSDDVAVRPPAARHAPCGSARIVSQPGAHEALSRTLRLGLERLPFSDEQRSRARELARDATEQARLSVTRTRSSESLAAAIAYAIVFVDEVPLTHAEVAAPFRVPVAQLRGCFAELRAELRITRGDDRYAT